MMLLHMNKLNKILTLIVSAILFALACSDSPTVSRALFTACNGAEANGGSSSGDSGSSNGGIAGSETAGTETGGTDSVSGQSGTDTGGQINTAGTDTGGQAAVSGSDAGGQLNYAGTDSGGYSGYAGDNVGGMVGGEAGQPPVDPRHTLVVIYAGQSNCASPANDAAGFQFQPASDPEVLFWATIPGRTPVVDSNNFGPLQRVADNTYGSEQTFGRQLKKENRRVVIVKIARGSTYISQWVSFPPGVPPAAYTPYYEPLLLGELDQARAALDALPEYGPEHCHFVWDQGEEDSRAALKKYPPQLGERWYESLGYMIPKIEEHFRCQVTTHVMVTNSALPQGAPRQLGIVRAQQEMASHHLYSDGYPLLTDQVHYSGTGQGMRGVDIKNDIEYTESLR